MNGVGTHTLAELRGRLTVFRMGVVLERKWLSDFLSGSTLTVTFHSVPNIFIHHTHVYTLATET